MGRSLGCYWASCNAQDKPETIWSKTSTAPQLRNSVLDLFYYHSLSKALSWAHILLLSYSSISMPSFVVKLFEWVVHNAISTSPSIFYFSAYSDWLLPHLSFEITAVKSPCTILDKFCWFRQKCILKLSISFHFHSHHAGLSHHCQLQQQHLNRDLGFHLTHLHQAAKMTF